MNTYHMNLNNINELTYHEHGEKLKIYTFVLMTILKYIGDIS